MTEELRQRIAKVISERVRPSLQADGGDIDLVEISDEGVVKVRLQGHCATCPLSAMTLAVGVERTVKDAVPEVLRIESVD